MTLRLDWCSHQAAKWAVEHWHYSRTLPQPPLVAIGAWEDARYIGAVLFSRGANRNLASPYGLDTTQVCELTRVALTNHATPTSRVVAVALRMLKKHAPGLRLCISFADANQGHIGTLYQAGGWLFAGYAKSSPKFITPSGKVLHQRQVSETGVGVQFGKVQRLPKKGECRIVPQLDKYRYLMPLDPAMRAQLLPLAKPYPRRQPLESEGPSDQGGIEGAAMRPVGSNVREVA